MEFIKAGTNINFVGKMKIAFWVSLAMIIISVVSLIVHGGLNLGIDFAGGTMVQIKFATPTGANEIRDALRAVNLEGSVIQRFGTRGENEFLIKTEKSSSDLKGLSDDIEKALATSYGTGDFEVRRVEVVGPKVGQDLRTKGILAILYAMVGILIYITWRFEFRYAIGAIIALLQDVFITVGIFSILGKEFTLPIVAALLTIIGYSLNDTIVVFDRIRENIKGIKKRSTAEVVNGSINQTLSRTLLTSLTTLLVVAALFFLGGAVIHDFAFALLVGIIVGTYSSVFVASPLILAWERIRPTKPKKKR
ncbi:MAG: protein translocase subunit SecF [Syntrophales bacterium]|jgi:preprotein translocase subunit SecF|nr:protein translocase subunit SecF [Syntrophales bacterium]MDY0043930.1 protein translocase subunit SecF [Syntrophales bacterium]